MKSSIRQRLEYLSNRLEEIDNILAEPNFDVETFRKLSCERSELELIANKFRDFVKLETNIKEIESFLNDKEMKELASEELLISKKRIKNLENELQILLLPSDPEDNKSLFLEIRAGTGGDESALFSLDLLRMYIRHAEQKNWYTELVSSSSSDLGGYKEAILKIDGHGAYGRLKFESGTHRVQRIPATESQGRVHTSACTVAVMVQADPMKDIVINNQDLRIDTFRASGAGGQHINKTDSAIRITHIPTGLVVECQEDRSQHRNKEKAMQILAARLKDKEVQEKRAKEATERKNLVGTGDRSERIRTYNFPQGRVTDHRINLTLYKLQSVLDGNLDELTDALISENQAEKLASLSLDE
ncbi:peptide chain release factor 1 [Candidatus Kinetoplastibacterium sorsogonicusi]|nr:peptide chain release factor 1 [Candidatus Kinetoplastibacterium sorsogonicusi]